MTEFETGIWMLLLLVVIRPAYRAMKDLVKVLTLIIKNR